MGYYSDVAIRFTRQAVDRMPQSLQYMMRRALGEPSVASDGSVLYCGCTKWYTELEDIRTIEQFLNSLESRLGEQYEFVRVGESEGDEEHRWTTCETILSIDRFINTDGFVSMVERKE